MNILYLLKTGPVREYLFSKKINDIKNDNKIFAAVFSKRNKYDLDKLNNSNQIFNKTFDYVDFVKREDNKNHKINWLNNQINKYEQKFDIPYNFALFGDRHIKNYDDYYIKLHIYCITNFLIKIIENNKVNKIVGELSSASDIISYYLSQYYNVPYLMMWHGRIDNKIAIENIEGKRLGLKEKYIELKERKHTVYEKKILDNYFQSFENNHIPDYEFLNKNNSKSKFKKKWYKRFYAYLKSYKLDLKYSADFPSDFKSKFSVRWNKLKYKLFKKNMIKKLFKDPNYSVDNYLLVPLHFKPESSTMTFAQYYLDTITHIKNLSKSIPGGWYLYVKEHPSMVSNRKLKELKIISRIPNVKLIDYSEDTLKLINNSKGVITLTNTTGYEGIVLRKPVYVFGNVFYDVYDYCFKCDNYKDFKNKIVRSLDDFDVNTHNYYSFILANLLTLKIGNLNSHLKDENVLSENNCKKVAKIILETEGF